MITRDEVIWTYRVMLDREPESEDMIMQHQNCSDLRQLTASCISSPEFTSRFYSYQNIGDNWAWAQVGEGLLKVKLSDRRISLPTLRGDYEFKETEAVKRLLGHGSVMCDVGANLGYFTILGASLVGSTGRVFSFEPLPSLFSALQSSVERNGWSDRVSLFNAAATDVNGVVSLQFLFNSADIEGASIVSGDVLAGHSVVNARSVRIADALPDSSRLDFVKIDVDGAEHLALKGAERLLRKFRPTILSKVHRRQLENVSKCTVKTHFDYMQDLGYDVRSLDGGAVDPGQISDEIVENVVFIAR